MQQMESSSLLPQTADQTVFEGDGGSYRSWSPSKSPFLITEAKLGAGQLVLLPQGFALPHYSDSSKIGYVLKGRCTVGLISPAKTSEEMVLLIEKGDAIPVPVGAVSWWFNGGDSEEVVIIFLGETTKSNTPGQFNYFFLTGTLGVLGGFSPKLMSKAFRTNEKEWTKLWKSQTGSLIIRLEEDVKMPQPCKEEEEEEEEEEKLGARRLDGHRHALPCMKAEKGGIITKLTAKNFPELGRIGLSATLVKLEAHAVLGPSFTADSSAQLIYVLRGGGRIEIAGSNSKNVLESELQAGQLFMVPKFFAATAMADEQGMDWFSVITSPEPEIVKLAGSLSIWKAFSPAVLQVSLGVTPETEENFRKKVV